MTNAIGRVTNRRSEGPGPGRYVTVLTAGLISGVLTITMGCAFSALIFSGPLSGYVPHGINLILFGAFVVGIFTSLTSSYAGTVARPHEIPVAIIALVASFIAGGMSGQASGGGVFITVVAAIAVTSVATGLFFLALGHFKAGNLVRFVPYPVIGGFLAGSGLLLIKGAFSVMTARDLTITNLVYFTGTDVLIKWVPGLILAAILFLVLRFRNHYLVMPVWLVASSGLFYLILYAAGIPVELAHEQGWLIGRLQGDVAVHPFTLASLAEIDWMLVLGQTGRIATILILSCISLLLTASGLEMVVREEVDLNRELRSVGFANVLSGLGGSTVGFHSLSLSALGYSMGTKSRVIGVFSAVLCGFIVFFGGSLLSYFPRPIMGGVLLFLGFSFLYEWLYETWFKLPKIDCILILLILVAIGTFGFLKGVGVGMLVAIVIFVVKYSHVSVVKHALTGISYHSNVDRAPYQRQVLERRGGELSILKLQGFIFFGTANNLYEEIRKRANDKTMPPLRFVVLDFRFVNGVDSSAVNGFEKMRQQAEANHYVLVFASLSPAVISSFRRQSFDLKAGNSFRMLPDLDLGMEWCENEMLSEEGARAVGERQDIEEQLRDFLPPSAGMVDLMKYLERREVPEGFYLIRQNDPPHSLYYIESGTVTVNLENEAGQRIRLRTLGPGTIIGEMGLYLRLSSTASVVTESRSVFYRLTAESLSRMEEAEPGIAAAFHRFIVRRMGERLVYANRSIEALLD